MRPRLALFPFAAFAQLHGVFRPATAPRTALPAGDGAWISAEDPVVAEHGGEARPTHVRMDLGVEMPRQEMGGVEPETSAQGVLAVHHLRKSYKARRVVEDVSMSVRRGEVVGLLGPNGAGKTTLFYMITGLI
ncbi:MAG: ATP-binding cassette domain-containing protein, partial [Methylocella sp.]